VTGDGSDDLVVFAATGGSGACGMYLVIDLAAGRPIHRLPSVCDTSLIPDPSIPGLVLTQAEFAPGDPHCCPSAVLTTTLTYDGEGWTESEPTRVTT
jgi:hypothetical protein